jgi:hypothetical protein
MVLQRGIIAVPIKNDLRRSPGQRWQGTVTLVATGIGWQQGPIDMNIKGFSALMLDYLIGAGWILESLLD